MAWSYDVNNIAGTASDVIFALKTLLKAAGWTVRMSGGGTGSGLYSSTGDAITTAAQMNGALSWFVIRQPVAAGHPQREFLFKHKANISGEPTYDIRVAAAGGYSAAGADEDTEPAATTDEQLIAGSALSSGGVALFPADNTYKYHMGCDTEPWGWYVIWSRNGSGNTVYGVVFDPLVAGTFPAADADPAVYNAAPDSTYTSPFGATLYTSGSRSAKFWFKKGLAGETWCSYATPGFISGFAFFYDLGSFGTGIPGEIGANPHSSKREHFPIMWGRGTSFVTAVGWKGIGSVQRWKGAGLVDFDTLAEAGVRTRIVADQVTFPWPDVAPVL